MQNTLPEAFNKYFWDTKIENLSKDKNATYIIERLLELGNVNELKWINENYSKEQILKTVQNSRRISPKTGNFFSLYYGIPKESLLCMKKHLLTSSAM